MEDLHEPHALPRLSDPLLEDLLHTLVGELTPDARMVVTLRFQEDLDLSEIAAIVDMPLNTVKSHLRRSMDALRRKLADRGHVYES
jgi:RNA polymerase sigma-70 factor (ECF subfamily)